MMSVREIDRSLEQWQMGVKDLRRRMILAPTPRERERWYALWLLTQGWTAAATAEALERDPHTIGRWASAFGEGGPAALREEAQQTGAKVFFADEAHFRADAELRGKWVLKGEPELVDSTSPRYGEKASYYSAVCLETGEVEWMELEGNSNSATSVAFLKQLREKHGGRLNVIWDNALAHRGEGVRELLRRPGLNLRLVNLPGYSPDFNADEAVWGWAREEVTGNLCLGNRAAVQERVGSFLAGLSDRKGELIRCCRTVLQSRTEGLRQSSRTDSRHTSNAHPTLALVCGRT